MALIATCRGATRTVEPGAGRGLPEGPSRHSSCSFTFSQCPSLQPRASACLRLPPPAFPAGGRPGTSASLSPALTRRKDTGSAGSLGTRHAAPRRADASFRTSLPPR